MSVVDPVPPGKMLLASFSISETREEIEVRQDDHGGLYPEIIQYTKAKGDLGTALAASAPAGDSHADIIDWVEQKEDDFSVRPFLSEDHIIPESLKWKSSEAVVVVRSHTPLENSWQPPLTKYRRLRFRRLGRFDGPRTSFILPMWQKLKANRMLDRSLLSDQQIKENHPEWVQQCGLAMMQALQNHDYAFFKELHDLMAVALHVRKGRGKRKKSVTASDEEIAIRVAIKLRLSKGKNPDEESLVKAVKAAGVEKGSRHWKCFLRDRCSLGFLLGGDRRKERAERFRETDLRDIMPDWLKMDEPAAGGGFGSG